MTAKEKAKDLFDMFNSKNDILFHQLDKEGAKECALTAVLWMLLHSETPLKKINFWHEVMQEIKKL